MGEAKRRGNRDVRVAAATDAQASVDHMHSQVRLSGMSYLEQFIESMRFLEFFQSDSMPDFTEVRRALLGFQSAENEPMYRGLLEEVLLPLGAAFLANSPLKVANSCHSVSHAYRHNFRNLPGVGDVFELAVTVGNIYYRGENIYQASRDSIRDLIMQGPRDGEDLPVHVWLTLEDMTVLDLTILASLRHRGQYEGPSEGMLVWRENDPGDFLFEPLLVDNLFATRVDNVTLIQPY
ncbi:hypothetical protein OR214_02334 [Ralstonia pickettii OR214]|jgi:hypothetical protein|uniref:Uncharacterized protein n=2 Tax=Ralstonia pickettii TaxID=329 RepID=R0DXA8_RALPI|nr:hypothetical protein OR214_02334 [Ralstonia pickettii OR214]